MVLVGGSVTHDSNVFRLPQSADTQARTGRPTRSDRISSMYTGLRLDKPYAQQRFLLDLTVSAYRYDNFSFLDFNALQYRSAWQWHLTPRWSGVLSAEREQALVSYADFRDLAQRNVRTMENRWLAVDGWLFEGWHLLAGLRQQEVRNSAPFVQLGSFRASGGDGGVRYVAGAGNSVDFRVRVLDGRYTDRTADPATLLDDGFSRVESEALATWIVTAKSTFDARIARVDYRATHFAQRDFSGTAARLGYRWAPTAKLSLSVTASRDLEPWSDSFASYRVDERLAFGPSWAIGPRTTLRMSLMRATSHFRNPVVPSAGAPRRDALNSALLAVDWKILRNVTFNASLQRQRQTSNDTGFEFEANVATLGASLMF